MKKPKFIGVLGEVKEFDQDHEKNYLEARKQEHNDLDLFGEPNKLTYTHGKDTGEVFPVGTSSTHDWYTGHLSQDTDYTNHEIKYQNNSHGLRGPEPNFQADKKILFAGGSMMFGTGVNVEDSFPYIIAKKLNADYISLAPVNQLIDLVEPLIQYIESYKPDHVILNDTRGVHEGEWFSGTIYKKIRKHEKQMSDNYAISMRIARQQMIQMFFKLIQKYHNNIHLFYVPTRYWSKLKPQVLEGIKTCKIEKDDLIDLGRDSVHPGPRSHQKIAEKFISYLNQ